MVKDINDVQLKPSDAVGRDIWSGMIRGNCNSSNNDSDVSGMSRENCNSSNNIYIYIYIYTHE